MSVISFDTKRDLGSTEADRKYVTMPTGAMATQHYINQRVLHKVRHYLPPSQVTADTTVADRHGCLVLCFMTVRSIR